MDISLAEAQEDLQSVYAKHALYHLTQENGSHDSSKAGVAASMDHTQGYQNLNEQPGNTVSDNSEKLFEPSNQHGKNRETKAQYTFNEFGSESSSFTLFNIAETSKTVQFDAVDTLPGACIKQGSASDNSKPGPCSRNQVSLMDNGVPGPCNFKSQVRAFVDGVPLDIQNADEIQKCAKNDREIQSKNTDIHPVELTKCVTNSHKPARITHNTNVKVVDLMDSKSINLLKRLWEKPNCASKQSKVNSPKAKVKSKKESTVTKENITKRKYVKKSKSVNLVKQNLNKCDSVNYKIQQTENCPRKAKWPVRYLKPCFVKVTKVETMNFDEINLKVNLSIPKTTDKHAKECKPRNKSKQTGKEITSENLIKTKEEMERVQMKESNKGYQPKVFDDGISSLFEEELDIIADSSDEYVPSEDEYKPSSKESLKHAFTKSKKRKKSALMQDHQYRQMKKWKHNMHPQQRAESHKEFVSKDSNSLSVIPKRKYVRRNVATKRIGRPPVLGHFECKHCSFTANEKNLVDKHMKVHKRPELKCRFCDVTFKAQNPLLEHEARKHTNDNPFKCSFEGCDYASKCKTDLNHHLSKHATEKKYVCHICGWATKWRRNLRSHHLMKHSDDRKFKCPVCSFEAKRNIDLKQHMYRHTSEKPIQCMLCGFQVKTNWELRSHMLSHSKEKPFACSYPGCNARTKTNADLTKHMRVHITERMFTCETCSKSFKCQTSLKKHYSIHVATRNFSCDICGHKFKSKSAMRKHLPLHSGVKPHKCPVCNMAFAVSSNMKSHMVTHDTANRPFLCPICPYAARHQDHLLAHIGSFHGKSYTYFCEICRKPFNRYGRLKIHYRRMHADSEMNSIKQLGLQWIKMEVKSELEKISKGMGQELYHDDSTTAAGEVRTDENLTTQTYVEEINDLRLNEATGEMEYIGNGADSKQVFPSTGNVVTEQTDSSENDLESCISAVKNEDGETVEMIQTNCAKLVENDIEDQSENSAGKIQQPVVCSSSTAKVAQYDGFRLSLATKGFAFNYEKTGKKPNAWFMDVSCMNERDSAKQQKYLRRIGVLPPLPKGKGQKTSLTAFVNRRKRKLTNNIRKSKMLKESKEVTKINGKRKARFQGNYTELEAVEEEEVTKDITKMFGHNGENENVTEKEAAKLKQKVSKKTKINTDKKILSASKNNMVKQKKAMKNKMRNSKPKLLLSSEKKLLVSKSKNIDIRKPSFMQDGGKSVDPNISQNVNDKQHNNSGQTLKKLSSVGRKRKLEMGTEKSKYNKKYIPVKKLKQTEENKQKTKKESNSKSKHNKKNNGPVKKVKQSGDNKLAKGSKQTCGTSKYNKKYIPVKKKKGEKKNLSENVSKMKGRKLSMQGSSPAGLPRKKLKVKFSRESFSKPSKSNNAVTSFEVLGEAGMEYVTGGNTPFIAGNHGTPLEPPVEMKMNQSDAALLNECGGMLDKVIILKTEVAQTESGENANEQIFIPVSADDSGIGADTSCTDGLSGGTGNSEHVKIEQIDTRPEDSEAFLIMEADTGRIKGEVSLDMEAVKLVEKGSVVFNDSGIIVKQEPEDLFENSTNTESQEIDK